MICFEEPIDRVLNLTGTLLTFADFEIYGLAGFNTSVLYKGELSLYEVEKQNFTFQVATADCSLSNIIRDITFTITDGIYVYTFKLDRDPISDLTGWSKLNVNFVGKVII